MNTATEVVAEEAAPVAVVEAPKEISHIEALQRVLRHVS